MNKGVLSVIVLVLLILLLMVLNLTTGSVNIPMRTVWAILTDGGAAVKESWRFIVWEVRLPESVTALLAGAALAVSGLLLQTAFRNPLAGPDVFGINSGAALAVALVMLGMGGVVSVGSFTASGFFAILLGAFLGAMLVTAVIFLFSTMVRNNVMLLIVGIMVGYISSSAISLLNFFATEEGVKNYMLWGMGSFGNVSKDNLPLFSVVSLLGLLLSLSMVKPLNVLLLGEQYAENLGVDTRRMRHCLLVVTGILTANVTAFCGPVAFIGLATPHMARLLLNTENHHRLLPTTMLMGAVMALLCNLLCYAPGEKGLIPLNAVTPLFGAPVIIYVLLRKRKDS